MLTMDSMTKRNVRDPSLSPNSAAPLNSVEFFSIFQLILLLFKACGSDEASFLHLSWLHFFRLQQAAVFDAEALKTQLKKTDKVCN